MKVFTTTLVKKNGKLDFSSNAVKKVYDGFVGVVPDGFTVNVIFELNGPKATLSQISKAHAACREIAVFTGHNFEDIKLLVKDKAGLIIKNNSDGETTTIIKSFGDCSKEEMSQVIQVTEEMCANMGIGC
jgi:hypothetical protein